MSQGKNDEESKQHSENEVKRRAVLKKEFASSLAEGEKQESGGDGRFLLQLFGILISTVLLGMFLEVNFPGRFSLMHVAGKPKPVVDEQQQEQGQEQEIAVVSVDVDEEDAVEVTVEPPKNADSEEEEQTNNLPDIRLEPPAFSMKADGGFMPAKPASPVVSDSQMSKDGSSSVKKDVPTIVLEGTLRMKRNGRLQKLIRKEVSFERYFGRLHYQTKRPINANQWHPLKVARTDRDGKVRFECEDPEESWYRIRYLRTAYMFQRQIADQIKGKRITLW